MTNDLVHGGALDQMRAMFPGAPEPWLDLSTGINPWPYPDCRVDPKELRPLPTREAHQECELAMALAFGASVEAILPAPGSELLIRLLPTLIAARRVAVLSPTYGDHARTWRQARCEVIGTDDPIAAAEEVDAVILCNPNNPDGRQFDPDTMLIVAESLAARGGWLIADEAYCDLCPARSLAPHGGKAGLIILRSFGKFFGLAGLRLGALIAPPDMLARMAERLGVWPISGPALAIGARAYRDTEWQSRMRRRLASARETFDALLGALGLEVSGGTDLFRLVAHPHAHTVWRRLANAGIYVRRFDWTTGYLRLGLPPDKAAEARLAEALSLSI